MPTYNAPIPHVEPISLVPGTQIRVDGRPTANANSFAINLQQGPGLNPRSPIVLHVAAVFGGPSGEDARVVRNHLVGDRWGAEENHATTKVPPFARGQHFSVLILVEEAQYKIAVNGTHFCEFSHRLPLASCSHLVIDGDLQELNFVEVVHAQASAPSAPTEPGFAPSGGLYPSLDNMPRPQGVNNNYPPIGGAPYPPAGAPGVPYPAHAGGGGAAPYPTPPPPYAEYPATPQPQYFPPQPPQPGYPGHNPGYPAGYPAQPPPPAGYPGAAPPAGYPTAAGYHPGAPPAGSHAGGGLGGIGTALGAGGVGAALGAAASGLFGGKKHKGHHKGHHSGGGGGPGLGTALGVGAGALAAGALLKHVNPLKKVKKIFD